MRTGFGPSLKLLLPDEGGFTHDRDGGGDTYNGVTQTNYDKWRQLNGEVKRSVKAITEDELNEFYRSQFWDAASCDRLPSGLDYAVFDYAVNSGPVQAVKDLQRVLGVAVDGHAGVQTLGAARDANAAVAIAVLCQRRLAFMKTLSNWKTNRNGWPTRVAGVQKDAIAMTTRSARVEATIAPVPVPAPPTTPPTVPVAAQAQSRAVAANQSVARTRPGIGAIIAASGVSGNALISLAKETIMPRVDETLLGRLALAAFVIVMLSGVGIVIYDVYRKASEKGSA